MSIRIAAIAWVRPRDSFPRRRSRFFRLTQRPAQRRRTRRGGRGCRRPVTDVDQVGPRRSDQTRHRLAHLGAMAAAGLDGYPVTAADAPATPVAALPTDWPYAARLPRRRPHPSHPRPRRVVSSRCATAGSAYNSSLDAATLTRGSRAQFAHPPTAATSARRRPPGRSRTGTDSLLVDSWTIEAKALHPAPFDAFQRPGEPAAAALDRPDRPHPGQAALLRQRSLVVRAIRTTLDAATASSSRDADAPTIHGARTARPFTTYISATASASPPDRPEALSQASPRRRDGPDL